MATPAAILNILVTANTRAASAQLMKVQGQMEVTEKKSHLLRNAAFGAGAALGVGLAAAAKTGWKELQQTQKAAAQTNAVLKSTGSVAHVSAKHVDELAQSILKKSGIDDEAVKSGENMLLTFRGVRNEAGRGNKIFDQATNAITDMTVAMSHGAVPTQEQMSRTAIQVGKALQDPIKGATALRRVGVQLSGTQQNVIKSLVGTGNAMDDLKTVGVDLTAKQKQQVNVMGDLASPFKTVKDLNLQLTDAQKKQLQSMQDGSGQMRAQKIILGELNKEFGGSAKQMGETLPGKIAILKETYHNLAGTIVGALVPALGKIVPKVTAFIQQMQDGKGAGGQFVDTMRNLGRELVPPLKAMVSIGKFLAQSPKLLAVAGASFLAWKAQAAAASFAAKAQLIGSFNGLGPAAAKSGTVAGAQFGAGVTTAATGRFAGLKSSMLAIGKQVGLSAAIGFALVYIPQIASAIKKGMSTKTENFGLPKPKSVDVGPLNFMKDIFPLSLLQTTANASNALQKFGTTAEQTFAKLKAGKDSRGLAELADQAQALAARYPGASSALLNFAGAADKAAKQAAGSFNQMHNAAGKSLSKIKQAVFDSTFAIQQQLGSRTAAGKEALAHNFQLAVGAIRKSMHDGLISTKTGLAEINKIFRQDLALYGITGKQASNYLSNSTGDLSGKGSVGKHGSGQGAATGGFIGRRGERGADRVPIVVGRGEAVLNRHQQGPVNAALMATYGFGLGGLFSKVRTPHFMASGGFAGLQPGVARAARSILGHFPGSAISSGYRTSMPLGHPDLHNYGEAVDIVGPNMNSMAAWIDRVMGRGLAEGIHNPNLSIKSGQHVPASFWGASTWAAHLNHIHVGVIGKLRAAGFSPAQIKRVLASGVGGAVGGVVQGGLDRVRSGANRALGKGFASGGFVGAAGLANLAGQAGFSKSAIPLAVAIALAESGGRVGASNRNSDGSIDRGLWQINSVHGRLSTFNPLANARAAYAISHGGHDWNPWTTFRTGAYKKYLTRGFAVQRLAGKVKRKSKIVASKGGSTGQMPGVGSYINGQLVPLPDTFDTPPSALDSGGGDTGSGTGEDPNQPLIDALNADAQAQADAAAALAALKDEVKRQNDFATSVANVTSVQAVRALADVISGQIVGVSYKGRALTASAGQTVRY